MVLNWERRCYPWNDSLYIILFIVRSNISALDPRDAYEELSDTTRVFTAVGRHHWPKIYSLCLHSAIFRLNSVQLLSLLSWMMAFCESLRATWMPRKWGWAQGKRKPRDTVFRDICQEEPDHSLVVMAQRCSGLASPASSGPVSSGAMSFSVFLLESWHFWPRAVKHASQTSTTFDANISLLCWMFLFLFTVNFLVFIFY